MRDSRDNPRDRPLSEQPDRVERRVEEERFVTDEPGDRPVERDLNRDLGRGSSRNVSRDVNSTGDREVRRSEVVEDYPRGERVEYSGVRYGSTGPYSRLALTDLVRWGPIIAGFAAAMALLLLMAVLGAAIGATSLTQNAQAANNAGTFGAIWAAISLVVAFFVGGWLAARTAGIGGRLAALVNSSIVWAFTLLFLILLASIGVAGGLGLVNQFGLPTSASNVSSQTSATAAWGTLIGLVLAWVASVVGGMVGMHEEPTPTNR